MARDLSEKDLGTFVGPVPYHVSIPTLAVGNSALRHDATVPQVV
jgi:hypothetical protein